MDTEAIPVSVDMDISKSAQPGLAAKWEGSKRMFGKTVAENYQVCESMPTRINPFCVIENHDSTVRLIHNGGQPEGETIVSMPQICIATKLWKETGPEIRVSFNSASVI